MLRHWSAPDELSDTLDAFAGVAGLDLRSLGTEADGETIRDTALAQPLIVSASLLSLRAVLGGDDLAEEVIVAGHSVGELAAAAITGVLSEAAAIALVATRGRAMAEAAQREITGMSAVLGGDPDDVLATLERHGLTPANVNGGGQVVAAGPLDALDALDADPPQRARVRRLEVAGAFHTAAMAGAVDAVREAADALEPADARLGLLSNADGARVHAGREVLDRIVAQISRPVRWDLCSAALIEAGVTGALELAPGGVLTGLARRTLPGVETVALRSADDVAAARDLVERHGGIRVGGIGVGSTTHGGLR